MDLVVADIKIKTDTCRMEYLTFDQTDRKQWKVVFDSWKELKLAMRAYQAREPNFPEGLSEVAFCMWSGSVRKIKCSGSHGSFDTFNLKTKRMEQIKACSVERDLTSFGPDSEWDDLYFIDFWNDGAVDGRFNVYKIDSDLVYNRKVNRRQTMRQAQTEGKRPRFSLKDVIAENRLQPAGMKVKVW